MAEKIAGFKKFSDFKKILVKEVTLSEITPDTDSDRPMTPNLLMILIKSKRIHSRKGIMPVEQN
jgi:hypothetical protein